MKNAGSRYLYLYNWGDFCSVLHYCSLCHTGIIFFFSGVQDKIRLKVYNQNQSHKETSYLLEWLSAKRQEISAGNEVEKKELSRTICECKLVQ